MNYMQAHENAVRTARNFRGCEAQLIAAIQEVISTRAWTYFDYSSLHVYAVEALNLSEDQAFCREARRKHTSILAFGPAKKKRTFF